MWPWTFGRAVVFLGTLFSVAVAQDEEEDKAISPKQIRQIFAQLDSDEDGKATLQDLVAFSQSMRSRVAKKDVKVILDEKDTNKDGKISLEELTADMMEDTDGEQEENWGGLQMAAVRERSELEAQKLKSADTDGDSLLDLSELPGLFYPETHEGVLEISAQAKLQRQDKDGDGKLSLIEFWAGPEEEAKEIDPSKANGHWIPTYDEEADFRKLDKNGDGFVDVNEFKIWESGQYHTQKALKQLFYIADSDRDGAVTLQELLDTRSKLAESDAHHHLMKWTEHHHSEL